MSPFDRAHTPSYSTLKNHASILYRFRDIPGYSSKVANFDPSHLHSAPSYGVTPVEFRGDIWRQKLESSLWACTCACLDARRLGAYCNSVLAAAPKTTTDKLQRVLNAAARVVSNTRKFDRGLSQLLHDDLHWLDVPDRVAFKLISHCSSVSERPCTELFVEPCHPSQRYRVTAAPSVCSTEHTCGPTLQTDHIRPSSIFVAGPTAWNSLPVAFRDPTDNQRCLIPTAFKDSSVSTTASAP